MFDVVRQYVDAALGALPKDRAMDLASNMLEQTQAGREQVQKLAADLMEWSRTSVERVTELVTAEVGRQVKTLGLATKADVDELKARLWKLEGAAPKPQATRKPAAGKAPASRKPVAKKKTPPTSS